MIMVVVVVQRDSAEAAGGTIETQRVWVHLLFSAW